MGVALPEWIFSQDKRAAPVILISLIGICVLLPLIVAACFLLRSNKYMGPNNVATETLEIFLRCSHASIIGNSTAGNTRSCHFMGCPRLEGTIAFLWLNIIAAVLLHAIAVSACQLKQLMKLDGTEVYCLNAL